MLKIFTIVMSVIVLAFLGSTVLFRSEGQQIPASKVRRNQDESRRIPDLNTWPIADYNAAPPTDALKRSEREIRSSKYDQSDWNVSPEDPSDNTVRLHFLDPALPAFPVKQSDVVAIGRVVQSAAYLSKDKTGVYSEFKVRIDEILEDCGGTFNIGDFIDVQREGARVRFASGRTHWYGISKAGMLVPASEYLLFLKKQNNSVLSIVTGYELTDNTVQPLDELPNSLTFSGAEQSSFLKNVRTQLINCDTK